MADGGAKSGRRLRVVVPDPAVVMQEAVTDSIVTGKFRWCRARLLHALARADEQGVLGEVLDELLEGEDAAVAERVRARLRERGWTKERT